MEAIFSIKIKKLTKSFALFISALYNSLGPEIVPEVYLHGEVAERLIAPVLKTGLSARVTWVRIPPSPP